MTMPLAFRAANPLEVPTAEFDMWDPQRHVYSRYTQNVSSRVERVLSKINVSILASSSAEEHISNNHFIVLQEGYAVTYASGLAASYAVRFP